METTEGYNMKRWTPGRKAIAQMFKYADRFMGWGANGDTRANRRGLHCKTQALIYMDREAVNVSA